MDKDFVFCWWTCSNVDIGHEDTPSRSRVIDLDVDIGADAVDYKCVYILYILKFYMDPLYANGWFPVFH